MEELKVVEVVDQKSELTLEYTQAQELTEAIKSTSKALYVLIKKAHDEQAWFSLGYKSWSAYIDAEFDFSRQWSYNLLNQANVIEEVSGAAGVELFITERDARILRDKLPEITEKIEQEVIDITDEEETQRRVNSLLAEYTEEYEEPSRPRPQGTESYEDEEYYDNTDDGDFQIKATEEEQNYSDNNFIEEKRELSQDEEMYVENFMRTLSIFDDFPTPTKLSKMIINSDERDEILNNAEKSYIYLIQLLTELN